MLRVSFLFPIQPVFQKAPLPYQVHQQSGHVAPLRPQLCYIAEQESPELILPASSLAFVQPFDLQISSKGKDEVHLNCDLSSMEEDQLHQASPWVVMRLPAP